MSVLLKIRSIDALKHQSREFALKTIYISDIDKKNHEIYASISCKLHLVDGLKANMLIGNDVLCTEDFAINLFTSFNLIHRCGIRIKVSANKATLQVFKTKGPSQWPHTCVCSIKDSSHLSTYLFAQLL